MHPKRVKNIKQPYKVQLELRGRLRDGPRLRLTGEGRKLSFGTTGSLREMQKSVLPTAYLISLRKSNPLHLHLHQTW